MDDTLVLEADAKAGLERDMAFEKLFTEMDGLNAAMRHRDVAIERTSTETRAILADIAEILKQLKAA